ncbi:MAG: HDOD domain-containing protein [Rhodoferax sp.]|nr:HDOD domain-containing protein [Rhodoferax sp.]
MDSSDAETSDTSSFSIARQHIVDANKSVVGYELFNRSQGARAHSLASDVSLVLNVMAQSGTKLANGQADLFLNTTHESLTGLHWDFLVPQRTIIEVPPVAGHDAAAIEETRLQMLTLRKRGFRLAFNHTVVAPVYKPWQGIADFVKVDARAIDPAKLKALVDAIGARTSAIAVAEKVESAAQFEVFKDIGFHFFQGYWFSRPEVLNNQVVSPSQVSAAQLFSKLRSEAEVDDIELAIKRDAALGFNLLRIINSAGLGQRTKITSIRQAVMLLGHERLQRWAALLMTAGVDGRPSLAGNMAVVRAKMMELLGQGSLNPEEREEAFLIGLFSLLDRMLGCTLAEALSMLGLDGAITEALLKGQGKYMDLLAMAIACEIDDDVIFADAAKRLGLTNRDINIAQMEAIVWADAITQQ